MILNVDEQPAKDNSITSSDGNDGGEVAIPTLNVPEVGQEVALTMISENGGDTTPLADGEVAITNADVAVTGNVPSNTAAGTITVDFSLVGPTWTAIKYYDASTGSLVNTLQTTTITLEFEDDGRLDGHAGCNNYFGGHSDLTESSFTIAGPMGSTMMMCEESIADQEMAYLSIFEGTIYWIISEDGTSLDFTDAEGATMATYALFNPLIIGPEWTATKYYASDGLVDVLPDSTITFTMETDERFGGNAGCNTYQGIYDDLTASSFKIGGPLISTLMLCGDLDDQEFAYLANFENVRQVAWAVLDDGSLELKDADTSKVLAVYTAGLEGSEDTLSTSAATSIGTAIAAFALLAVAIFV